MRYHVVCKRYSVIQKNLDLVEMEIDADGFYIADGCLIFHDGEDQTLHAIPGGAWLSVDPEPLGKGLIES